MKTAIMQPYFLPYIGYFQLANSADTLVIYDNLKYTKKGWINRNRYKIGNTIKTFTLPLEKDSDYALIGERRLATSFDRNKTLNTLLAAYQKAPFRDETAPLLTRIFQHNDVNLFNFIQHSLSLTFAHLNIRTALVTSSDVDINHELRGEEKVIALCQAMQADTYINPPGGTELYQKEHFLSKGIELRFIRPKLLSYEQGAGDFVPALSILDLLMWLGRDKVINNHMQPNSFF